MKVRPLRRACATLHLLLLCTLFAGSNPGFADDFTSSQPFSLRFDAALSRYGNYGDVIGVGGASAGSTFSSSANPASTAVRNATEYKDLTLSPQRTSIEFDNGHDLGLTILGGAYRIDDQQKIEFGIARVDSSSATRRGDPAGSAFKLEANLYTVGWSTSIGARNDCNETGHYFGADYSARNTESTLDANLGFGSMTVVTDKVDSSGINVGYLYQTHVGGPGNKSVCSSGSTRNNLALGIVVTLGDSESDRDSLVAISGKSASEGEAIRFGAGYRIGQGRYLYSDLQYATYENTDASDVTESIHVARLFTGVQWQIPALPQKDKFRMYLRGGIVLDKEGNKSQAFGIGSVLKLGEAIQVGVDLGLQRDMFPELEPEFGDSDLVNLSFRLKIKN